MPQALDLARQRDDRPGRRLRSSAIVAALAGFGIFLLLDAADFLTGQREQAAIGRAFESARQQAHILKIEWAAALDRIAAIQAGARPLALALLSGKPDAVAHRQADLELYEAAAGPEAGTVSIAGADGALLWPRPLPLAPPVSVAGEPYFQAIARDGQDSFAGEPALDSLTGEMAVPFARAVRDGAGALRALIVVKFRTSGVNAFLAEMSLQPGSTFAVLRGDGAVLALSGGPKVPPGMRLRIPQNCPEQPGQSSGFTATQVSPLYPSPRLHAFECVPGSNTLVGVGLDQGSALLPTRAATTQIWSVTALAAAMFAAAAVLAMRALHSRDLLQAARRREKALLEDLTLFRELTDNAGVTLFKCDEARTILYASPSVRALLGRDPDSLTGQPISSLMEPSDLPQYRQRVRQLEAGTQPGRAEYVARHSNGTMIAVEAESRRVPQADGSFAYYTAIRDVTAERGLLRSLEEAKRDIEEVLRSGPGALLRTAIDTQGHRRFTYVSPSIEQLTGYTPGEIAASGHEIMYGPLDLARLRDEALAKSPARGQATMEFDLTRKDGRTIKARSHLRQVELPGGGREEFSYLMDVTEQHIAEQSQQAAEARLTELIERSPAVLVQEELLPDGTLRLLYISPNAERLTGFAPRDAFGDDTWATHVDEAAVAGWPDLLARAQEYGVAGREYRFRHRDGHWLTLSSNMRAESRPDGSWLLTGSIGDVTALRAAERELLQAQSNFANLIETGPGILMRCAQDADGGWHSYWRSDNFERITGYSHADTKTRGYMRGTTRVDVGQARAAALRASPIPGQASWDYDTFQNGKWRRMGENMRLVVNSDGKQELVVYTYDITELHESKQQIQAAKERIDTLLGASPGVLFQIEIPPGEDERLIFASDAVTRVTGYSADEIVQAGLASLYAAAGQRAHAAALRQAIETGEASYEVEYTRSNASTGWAHVDLHVTIGGRMLVTGYFLDVTRQRNQQAQIAQSAKLAMLGELTTSIAHELKQPLAVMSMAAENTRLMIQQRARAEDIDARLDRIVMQSRRAAGLIDHLRVFGRSQGHDIAPVELTEAVEGMMTVAQAKLRDTGTRVVTDVPPGLLGVSANKVLLEQVLLNLITNACDAYEDHAQAADAPRIVSVAARAEAGRVIVTIADHAGGIPADAMPRIFEPFFTTKPEGHGTGLGLSFSHGVIADMGGTLTVHNADGGAVFEISLPQAEPAAAA